MARGERGREPFVGQTSNMGRACGQRGVSGHGVPNAEQLEQVLRDATRLHASLHVAALVSNRGGRNGRPFRPRPSATSNTVYSSMEYLLQAVAKWARDAAIDGLFHVQTSGVASPGPEECIPDQEGSIPGQVSRQGQGGVDGTGACEGGLSLGNLPVDQCTRRGRSRGQNNIRSQRHISLRQLPSGSNCGRECHTSGAPSVFVRRGRTGTSRSQISNRVEQSGVVRSDIYATGHPNGYVDDVSNPLEAQLAPSACEGQEGTGQGFPLVEEGNASRELSLLPADCDRDQQTSDMWQHLQELPEHQALSIREGQHLGVHGSPTSEDCAEGELVRENLALDRDGDPYFEALRELEDANPPPPVGGVQQGGRLGNTRLEMRGSTTPSQLSREEMTRCMAPALQNDQSNCETLVAGAAVERAPMLAGVRVRVEEEDEAARESSSADEEEPDETQVPVPEEVRQLEELVERVKQTIDMFSDRQQLELSKLCGNILFAVGRGPVLAPKAGKKRPTVSKEVLRKLQTPEGLDEMVELAREQMMCSHDDVVAALKQSAKMNTEECTNDDKEDNGDLQESCRSIKLLCPVSCVRIEVPARTKNCMHLECFDLRTHLALNAKNTRATKKTWRCPVCNKSATWSEIIVDGFLATILASLKDTNEVQILPDAKWRPVMVTHNGDKETVYNSGSGEAGEDEPGSRKPAAEVIDLTGDGPFEWELPKTRRGGKKGKGRVRGRQCARNTQPSVRRATAVGIGEDAMEASGTAGPCGSLRTDSNMLEGSVACGSTGDHMGEAGAGGGPLLGEGGCGRREPLRKMPRISNREVADRWACLERMMGSDISAFRLTVDQGAHFLRGSVRTRGDDKVVGVETPEQQHEGEGFVRSVDATWSGRSDMCDGQEGLPPACSGVQGRGGRCDGSAAWSLPGMSPENDVQSGAMEMQRAIEPFDPLRGMGGVFQGSELTTMHGEELDAMGSALPRPTLRNSCSQADKTTWQPMSTTAMTLEGPSVPRRRPPTAGLPGPDARFRRSSAGHSPDVGTAAGASAMTDVVTLPMLTTNTEGQGDSGEEDRHVDLGASMEAGRTGRISDAQPQNSCLAPTDVPPPKELDRRKSRKRNRSIAVDVRVESGTLTAAVDLGSEPLQEGKSDRVGRGKGQIRDGESLGSPGDGSEHCHQSPGRLLGGKRGGRRERGGARQMMMLNVGVISSPRGSGRSPGQTMSVNNLSPIMEGQVRAETGSSPRQGAARGRRSPVKWLRTGSTNLLMESDSGGLRDLLGYEAEAEGRPGKRKKCAGVQGAGQSAEPVFEMEDPRSEKIVQARGRALPEEPHGEAVEKTVLPNELSLLPHFGESDVIGNECWPSVSLEGVPCGQDVVKSLNADVSCPSADDGILVGALGSAEAGCSLIDVPVSNFAGVNDWSAPAFGCIQPVNSRCLPITEVPLRINVTVFDGELERCADQACSARASNEQGGAPGLNRADDVACNVDGMEENGSFGVGPAFMCKLLSPRKRRLQISGQKAHGALADAGSKESLPRLDIGATLQAMMVVDDDGHPQDDHNWDSVVMVGTEAAEDVSFGFNVNDMDCEFELTNALECRQNKDSIAGAYSSPHRHAEGGVLASPCDQSNRDTDKGDQVKRVQSQDSNGLDAEVLRGFENKETGLSVKSCRLLAEGSGSKVDPNAQDCLSGGVRRKEATGNRRAASVRLNGGKRGYKSVPCSQDGKIMDAVMPSDGKESAMDAPAVECTEGVEADAGSGAIPSVVGKDVQETIQGICLDVKRIEVKAGPGKNELACHEGCPVVGRDEVQQKKTAEDCRMLMSENKCSVLSETAKVVTGKFGESEIVGGRYHSTQSFLDQPPLLDEDHLDDTEALRTLGPTEGGNSGEGERLCLNGSMTVNGDAEEGRASVASREHEWEDPTLEAKSMLGVMESVVAPKATTSEEAGDLSCK